MFMQNLILFSFDRNEYTETCIWRTKVVNWSDIIEPVHKIGINKNVKSKMIIHTKHWNIPIQSKNKCSYHKHVLFHCILFLNMSNLKEEKPNTKGFKYDLAIALISSNHMHKQRKLTEGVFDIRLTILRRFWSFKNFRGVLTNVTILGDNWLFTNSVFVVSLIPQLSKS